MSNMISWFTEEESGQGLVEYALILTLIAVAAVTAMTTLGGNINTQFNSVAQKIQSSRP